MTAHQSQHKNIVRLQGNTLVSAEGQRFNGLGVSYMQALRRCKYDRPRFESDLSFLAARGFNYIRILSMVGWNPAWRNIEIAPIGFLGKDKIQIAAWPDYWRQLRDCIDVAFEHGLLTEITIFADAQLMPSRTERLRHLDLLLENLAGREHKVILLEVANEAWQNGFAGQEGVRELRDLAEYLGSRTEILVAISATEGANDFSLQQMYAFSAADIATEHFSRDTRTPLGGWVPVTDCWRVRCLPHLPPASSNEPIGPGSSVQSEKDPVKLVMAAAFAWGADLPMYVYHTRAGVFGDVRFEDMAGVGDFRHLHEILPGDFASWVGGAASETEALFSTTQPGGLAPGSAALPLIIKCRGPEFIALPLGIPAGGLEVVFRKPAEFRVYHPVTGKVAASVQSRAGERVLLPPGSTAYIIRGRVRSGVTTAPATEPARPAN